MAAGSRWHDERIRTAEVMTGRTESLEVRLVSMTFQAQSIISLEFRCPHSKSLPRFSAGAHIDLHLPNGLTRSYSLTNPQHEQDRYCIAVRKDSFSRGGSRFIHDHLRVGDMLTIRAPSNNFALVEDARHSVLIAGGIGITPLWCMIQRLCELDRSWELYYCSRTRAETAFLDVLQSLNSGQGKVHFHFDHESGGELADVAAMVEQAVPDTHLYCCGPVTMLSAFEAATAARAADFVHTEYFSPKEGTANRGGFTVELARSGCCVEVPAGKTILDALLDEGYDVQFACSEGICGTCETRVISGVPDHRDAVLTAAERETNRTMMICCSGSKSERLVLDL
jgi:vanillate O-demethylase ferredoxin subunit